MAKILVLYYSMYGHIETMAHAVADGANRVDGVEVVVKRVPETMQAEAFAKAGGKTQNAPVATPQELAEYDAIIFGTPTRFGNMSGQMRTFLDQTGGLWASGALYGKIASVFSSTGTGGGQNKPLPRPDDAGPPRHDHRPDRLWRPGAIRYLLCTRRYPLWRNHHRRRRRLAAAERGRVCHRPLSG